jgi:hypothetical protein
MAGIASTGLRSISNGIRAAGKLASNGERLAGGECGAQVTAQDSGGALPSGLARLAHHRGHLQRGDFAGGRCGDVGVRLENMNLED